MASFIEAQRSLGGVVGVAGGCAFGDVADFVVSVGGSVGATGVPAAVGALVGDGVAVAPAFPFAAPALLASLPGLDASAGPAVTGAAVSVSLDAAAEGVEGVGVAAPGVAVVVVVVDASGVAGDTASLVGAGVASVLPLSLDATVVESLPKSMR
jgi:hypothetical protein